MAYSVKRDFLSTPRTYAILSLTGALENKDCIKEFVTKKYFVQKNIAQQAPKGGFYQLSSLKEVLLLILGDRLLEIKCSDFDHVDTLYYYLDSHTAVMEYINSI